MTSADAGMPSQGTELHFTDVAEMRGIGQVSLQSIGWGASFLDFDSDGWLDLVVANGSTFEMKQPPRQSIPMPSFLFWNPSRPRRSDPWCRAMHHSDSRGPSAA